MKKLSLLLCGCMAHLLSAAQTAKPALALIPQPVKVTQTTGQFVLPKTVVVEAGSSTDVANVTAYLKRKLSTATGAFITVKSAAPTAPIRLILNKTADTVLKTEGYKLSVTSKKVVVRANDAAGLFYGVQTFFQLLPKEIEGLEVAKGVKWTAPAVEITDYPRFGWRGLMFDVSRHFFTKAEVKQYIDAMVKYKFNLLHLHLTDDEGWRVEIKSLPRLTEVGSHNVKKVGQFGTFTPPTPDEPRTYGGFYTQEDIKELVQYAKDKFVNILPEIDVPGHSLAAVVAYPELSCTPGADKYVVNSGEPFMDWSGPHNRAIVDNTLCPANEAVYTFMDKVVTEVAQLFPFGYIHLGGDECAKNFWEQSDAIKALMAKENLKTMSEVQAYFEKRLEKIVESKGKKFMGWDEIIEGGLGPNAAVMSWRGIQGGIIAAKAGHEVVMSPTTFAYLDYMQSDRVNETKIYATLRLNKTYSWEPVPDSVDARLIKGGQANLWTEQVYNIRQAEYMTWPRGMAIAEDVWSPKGTKNWDGFFSRVEKHFPRFDEAETKIAPSAYDPSFDAVLNPDSTLKITLTNEVNGLDTYYSFDNSFPDRFYPKYTEPIDAPKDATTLRVITYRGKKPIGRMVTMPLAELKSRIKK
ncbi:family 20 glycosylhydrolase [Mucilaginibacter rubeus]|uniref:beta-N-acetylhexosaminidase n=1 Tax=Mucilaginibacter rubeus TaxID=2027860 RepID=A0AAE6ML91_9SPHI|nr:MULTISPECIES: family 20 glycosylhydrolase [Mucilaginibacter]QEM07536.1 family 20 glycosylhydrolase [Mucilaginibacter rubeus]QEM19990.1 family 20 glycosylhydrolase [Mucilaginibacter gossypii]QTE43301.1 family 20 glycosylhydrolase [Mucilaginibacter rubeus]QTE49901.1 family 20 glycosylhydrolase [Mucilaginibacter rubeus]QTE54992.1 family 20 glycosylhydrolase [Mucilaginibacter rubeus]